MSTSFRPALNALETRLNLSADYLPVLIVIADRQDVHQGNQSQLDFVAARATPPECGHGGGWIDVDSVSFGTGRAAAAARRTHTDFLWAPTGRNAADAWDYGVWRRNFGAGLPSASGDGDMVLKGSTIDVNAGRSHGAVRIVKEWDAIVPHGTNVDKNESITIHASRTE